MAGKCIEKIKCPECGSGDGLQVFHDEEKGYNGYCYACEKYYVNPYDGIGKKEIVEQESNMDVLDVSLDNIKHLPIRELKDRCIEEYVCEDYGVRVEVSQIDGETVTRSYYPDTKDGKLVGYEVRNHENKSFYAIGDRKGGLELWGSALARTNNGRKLFITEGRLDAMSLYQAIQENNKYNAKPSVVSLTRGAASAANDLVANREFLEKFKEIVLVFDNDTAGKKAVRQVIKLFPLCKVATLPLKDANDMLMEGRSKELFEEALFKAEVQRQGEVLDVEDFIETALIKPEMGIDTPWPRVTKLIYGLRPHTIHIVGAAPKIGKSDHEYQWIHHISYVLGQKVGVFDLENPPAKTAKKIASKEDGIDYTKPDSDFDLDVLRSTLLKQQGLIKYYDRGASREWDDIRVSIELMHQIDGINVFFIDPITALISRFASTEANDKLNEIMTDASDLVHKFPITLLFYSHVNPKPKGAKTHEEGGRVLSSEFTGSRAMEKWAHYGWGIRRNRSPECPPEEQNVSYLDLLFDRDFGNSGSVPLFFNSTNMRYLEMTSN